MEIRPGSRWKSAVCSTEVVVVRAAAVTATLGCGGAPMVTDRQDGVAGPPDPTLAAGTLLGKRYADAAGTVELLCTKSGAGTLTLDGVALPQRDAKPLPASD